MKPGIGARRGQQVKANHRIIDQDEQAGLPWLRRNSLECALQAEGFVSEEAGQRGGRGRRP